MLIMSFLHGYIFEEVYMKPPQGCAKTLPGQVCSFKRFLYGPKQASRQWNCELTLKLLQFCFLQSTHYPCLFIYCKDDVFLALLVYMDDVLLSGNSDEIIQTVKDYLHQLFTVKDIGQARYFLGIELARSDDGLYINQRKYFLDLLHDAGLSTSKPVATPLPRDCRFDDQSSPLLADPDKFRRLVGRLLYFGFTRPDVTFATQQLSQFVQAPTEQH
ncbi:hypothetical protein Syun_012510 [Stephania yunnanensis]|uniref:Reverse transcriptase Ty1/copia-type domain-containing protein n=1 Tax=Stephania yunnanensis TaxID=152371 RepID=A0AAP0PJ16_9MAGN